MTMNVVGASICDEELIVQGEARDIQLPNTEHVSQISVDVSITALLSFVSSCCHSSLLGATGPLGSACDRSIRSCRSNSGHYYQPKTMTNDLNWSGYLSTILDLNYCPMHRLVDRWPKLYTFPVGLAPREVDWTFANLRQKRLTTALNSSAGFSRNQGLTDQDTSLWSRQQVAGPICTTTDSETPSASTFSARTRWSAWSQVRCACCCSNPGIYKLHLSFNALMFSLSFCFSGVLGLNFLITEIPFEVFTYSETNPMCFEETPADKFPYMVRYPCFQKVDFFFENIQTASKLTIRVSTEL